MTIENQIDAIELEASAGAIELSEDELDTVSGGAGFDMGAFKSFMQGSSADFSQVNVSMDEMTFAGPNGAGTMKSFDFQKIGSSSDQFTAFEGH